MSAPRWLITVGPGESARWETFESLSYAEVFADWTEWIAFDRYIDGRVYCTKVPPGTTRIALVADDECSDFVLTDKELEGAPRFVRAGPLAPPRALAVPFIMMHKTLRRTTSPGGMRSLGSRPIPRVGW